MLDSGWTQHMTGEARMFNSIDTSGNSGFESITFGDNGKVWGYGPRYPQDKTWAAPSEVAQPTRSRHAWHWSMGIARYCIVLNRILSL